MAYNLVQMADFLKGLDNKTLQGYLMQPPGELPAFLVAAEAARRKDIEQKMTAASPQNNSTVLDELISSRSQQQGIGQLAPQVAKQAQAPMAPPQPPQMAGPAGLAALEQPQMASGGPVKRMAGGALVQTNPDATRGLTFTEMGQGLWDEAKRLWDGINTPIDLTGAPGRPQSEADADKPSIIYPQSMKDADKDLAEQKKAMSAVKSAEMGNPQGGVNDTQPNGAEATKEDEIRARLAKMTEYEKKEYLAGLSPSEWFMLSSELLNPNQNVWQAIAAGGSRVAESVESRQAEEKLAKREQERALLEYDISQIAANKDAAAAGRSEQIDAYKTYLTATNSDINNVAQMITSITREMNDYVKDAMPQPGDPQLAAYQEQLAGLRQKMSDLQGLRTDYMKRYGEMTGTYAPLESSDGTSVKPIF